jgi:type IV pilus assembly protein PilV
MKQTTMTIRSTLYKRQDGATLLEVLVSIVIVALGLLGYAGLQAVSIKSSNTAYYRSQATMLAYDVIDRMRVTDMALLDGGAFDMDYGADPVSADAVDWKTNNVETSLPGGMAKVIFNAGDRTVQVNIKWTGADGEENVFQTTSRL